MSLRSFLDDCKGNIATLTVVLSLPLLIGVGLSVDYTRYVAAHAHLQDLNDAVAIALAASDETDNARLMALGSKVLAANSSPRMHDPSVTAVRAASDKVEVDLSGSIPATFIGLAGRDWLYANTSATAERASNGPIEVALILDNTYSMAGKDAYGVMRLDAIKSAATKLVDDLMSDSAGGSAKFALVPYADHVNVGMQHRRASWIDVPPDTTSPEHRSGCTMKKQCKRYRTHDCTRMQDGQPTTVWCEDDANCAEFDSQETEHCEWITPAGNFSWYGCVGSRVRSWKAINNDRGSEVYRGFVSGGQECSIPLVPLTSDKTAITTAIGNMTHSHPERWYFPETYIPAGLMWGLNVLSPTEPFAQAAPYVADGGTTRKVAVLMTDGANTLRLNTSNQRDHVGNQLEGLHFTMNDWDSEDTKTFWRNETRENTLETCAEMKRNGITIFAVAFALGSDLDAKAVMEGCASSRAHYFDAEDSGKLTAAFGKIGSALRVVRLTH